MPMDSENEKLLALQLRYQIESGQMKIVYARKGTGTESGFVYVTLQDVGSMENNIDNQ